MLTYDKNYNQERPLTGPLITGAVYDRLTQKEKNKAKKLRKEREDNPIFWQVQRDRKGFNWSNELLETTKREAEARPERLITEDHLHTGDIYWALARAYGHGNIPHNLGKLVNDRRFRSANFPDHEICNCIPPIWNINLVKRGPNKGRETEVKKQLAQLFSLGNTGLTDQPRA